MLTVHKSNLDAQVPDLLQAYSQCKLAEVQFCGDLVKLN